MKKNNKKAFTLVELLVVIAIIAILAVVSVVGYTAFTQKARDAAAKEELSQFITLLRTDDLENDKIQISGTTLTVTDENLKQKESLASSDITGLLTEAVQAELTGTLKGTFSAEWSKTGTGGTISSITYKTENGGTATYYFATQDFKPAA